MVVGENIAIAGEDHPTPRSGCRDSLAKEADARSLRYHAHNTFRHGINNRYCIGQFCNLRSLNLSLFIFLQEILSGEIGTGQCSTPNE